MRVLSLVLSASQRLPATWQPAPSLPLKDAATGQRSAPPWTFPVKECSC